MRLAAISDMHFGDPACALLDEPTRGQFQTNAEYFEAMVGAMELALGDEVPNDWGPAEDQEELLDYLVLLGDVFDISLATYERAIKATSTFLQSVVDAGLAKEVIYIPGNHDADLWHLLEYEVNVINRLRKRDGESNWQEIVPRDLKGAVPGVIDDRKGTTQVTVDGKTQPWGRGELYLHGVSPGYGDTYLKYLVLQDAQDDASPALTINVAYPNLYVIDDKDEAGRYPRTTLLTHGHYLKGYWSFVESTLAKLGSGDFSDPADPDDRTVHNLPLKAGDIRDVSQLNFPGTQLACTGMGQAGTLSALVRRLHYDFSHLPAAQFEESAFQKTLAYDLIRTLPKVIAPVLKKLVTDVTNESTLRLIRQALERWAEGNKVSKRWVLAQVLRNLGDHVDIDKEIDRISKVLAEQANRKVREFGSAKADNHSSTWQPGESGVRRIREYLWLVEMELGEILHGAKWNHRNPGGGLVPALPKPELLIFGHTHRPISFQQALEQGGYGVGDEKTPMMVNSGSWLLKSLPNEQKVFSGAEVVVYESSLGWTSQTVQ